MITAVSLNPCNDKTVKVQRFTYGGMNRIIEERIDGGGKGINVSVSLKRIGCDVSCIGILQQNGDAQVRGRLDSENVPHAFIVQPGTVRTNLKIQDLSTGFTTEINENGERVDEAVLAQVTAQVEEWAKKSELMIFSGSLPPGTPVDFYQRLIETANRYGCRCVLDAEGERLSRGLLAKPYMIKPNLYELQSIVGGKVASLSEVREAAETILEAGVKIVAVSMGSDGSFITNGREAFFAPPLGVKVQSATGAGDSMVAGLCKGLREDAQLKEMFRYGVAAATASVMAEGTEVVRREDYETLLDMVDVRHLED